MTEAKALVQPGGGETERWAEGPSLTASMWRYRWMVLAVAVVAGLAGFFVSQLQTPMYQATARMFLTTPGTAGVFDRQMGGVIIDRYLPQQAARATSLPVLTAAAEVAGDDLTPAELYEQLAIEYSVELVTLTVAATDADADRAADLANAVASAYQEAVREAQLARVARAVGELERTAAEIEERIAELDEAAAEADEDGVLPSQAGQIAVLTQRLSEIDGLSQQLLVDARLFGSGVELFEPAEPPTGPVSPRPRLTAIATFILGALVAGAVAYWLAGRARPVVSRDDPATVLGVPLLGILPTYEVPEVGTLAQRTSLEPSVAEAYRFVFSSLHTILGEIDGRSVMFTSAGPGVGKTETALQMAATAQRRGLKVLLIDADLRMRGLSTFLRTDRIPGLLDLAASRTDVQAESLILPYELDDHRHLDILTAGRPIERDGDHISESWFGHAFEDAIEDFDVAIVDAPPLLAVADTATIAGYTDAIVLVVREGSDIDELERVRHRLRFVRQRLVGYVYVSPSAADDKSLAYGLGSNSAWANLDRGKKNDREKSSAKGAPDDSPANVYNRWFGAQPPSPPPMDPASKGRKPRP
jgi:Mrp family chromosome partitioning ATPase